MELREYFRILLKYLWLIVLIPLIAVNVSLNFSYTRTPIYEATSSYVVGLNAPADFQPGNTIYGFQSLFSQQERIPSTYCQILTSRTVRIAAVQLMNVPDAAFNDSAYNVTCSALPDTLFMRVTVQGPVPAITTRLNDAIGAVGIREIAGRYSLFPLQKLDDAALNEVPVSPSPMQNAVLAGAFGLVIALALAVLLEYMRSPGAVERMTMLRRPGNLNVKTVK